MGGDQMGVPYTVVADQRNRHLWLAAHRDGIGSSDAAAILGLNPWRSALEVYAAKLGLSEEDDDVGPVGRFGQNYEAQVAADFAADLGRRVRIEGRLLRSRAYPWQQATLDARQFVERRRDAGLLEIKTIGPHMASHWDDGVPEYVTAQVQHQFAVTGMRWGSVAVFDRGSCEIRVAEVEPDSAFIKTLVAEEAAFWSRVIMCDPPPPDSSASAARALRKIFAEPIEGKTVDLDGEYLVEAEELELIRSQERELRDRKRAIENRIKAAIGDAEIAQLPDGSQFTYRMQHRGPVGPSDFRVLRYKGA